MAAPFPKQNAAPKGGASVSDARPSQAVAITFSGTFAPVI